MQTVAELEIWPQTISERAVFMICPACGGHELQPFVSARDYFFMRETRYELTRCAECHLCWLSNPPRVDQMSSHYGHDYDQMIIAPGDLYPRHWNLVRNKLMQYVRGGVLLDIGCSSGSFLRSMKSPSWKLYGIEMSQPVAEHASATTGAEVFVGDVLEGDFAENSFDAVTGFHVLEHMYDPGAVMKKVLYWLKPGGVFTITLPNVDSLEARLCGRYWWGLDVPRHLWQFSPRALSAIASSVGLEVVEVGTTRSCYLDNSIRNWVLEMKLACGRPASSPAKRKSVSKLERLMQKAFRVAVVYPFRELAVVSGAGADLHAVFRKPSE